MKSVYFKSTCSLLNLLDKFNIKSVWFEDEDDNFIMPFLLRIKFPIFDSETIKEYKEDI